MSGFASHPDDSDESLDQWLADQHRHMVTDLAATLDVEAGLRESMISARHANLVADLGEVLDVEAGLSAIVPTPPDLTPPELVSAAVSRDPRSRGPSTRFARLVGCSDYEDPTFQRLSAPAQDVDALARVLADPAIGDFTVDSLLNEPSGVVRERIEEFFANRQPDDLLLLYFSCHGVLDPSGRLYFVAADTKNGWLDSTGISAQWVTEQMDQSRSRRIVLLLDCCYSGAFASAKKISQQLGGRGRVVITASGKTELAYGSEFTNAVVQGLETGAADLDGDGQVSVRELYHYVSDQVRQNRTDQTPTISTNGRRRRLYLAKNPPLPLPVERAAAVTSEMGWKRRWAVDGLRLLLAGDHPGGQRRAARQALARLRDDDTDLRVRAAARKVLRRVFWRSGVSLGLVLAVVLGAVLFIRHQDKPIACSPSAKPADGVLTLGTLFPKTGAFIYSGPALDAGARLAMKDINAAGGIPGIVVRLDEANQPDEGNPSADTTASQSTDALLAGGVDVIVGPATSPVALKVIDKVVCAGVVMFAPGNTSPVFTTYPDHGLYFRTAPLSTLEGPVLGKLVVGDGNSTAVVMSRDDSFGNPLREETEKAIRESGGEVLDSFSYDPNAREYDKEVQRVKAKRPDAIVVIGLAESAQILVKMIKEGIGPRDKRVYVAGASMTNTLVAQVSPRDPGVLAGMKGTPLDTGGEAFVTRLREDSPGLQDLVYAPQAYDAVVITALAAAVAGTDEPAAIAREINEVTKNGEKCTSFAACITLVKDHKNIDYDGPSGPLEFADPGEPRSATYVISEIQADGTVKPLRSERVDS